MVIIHPPDRATLQPGSLPAKLVQNGQYESTKGRSDHHYGMATHHSFHNGQASGTAFIKSLKRRVPALLKEHKRARKNVPVGDFWSRVDSQNIPIAGLLKAYIDGVRNGLHTDTHNAHNGKHPMEHHSTHPDHSPIHSSHSAIEKAKIVERMGSLTEAELESIYPNYSIITTCVADYSYKTTPFGDVYYSPRFQDEKYIYRYVILTRGVKTEAYRILKSCGTFLLTEQQIIRELAIDLSPGWEHFMLFRNKLDELILRRRIGT